MMHWKVFMAPVGAFKTDCSQYKSINSSIVKYRTAVGERRNGYMDLQILVCLGQPAMSSDHLKPVPTVGLYHR